MRNTCIPVADSFHIWQNQYNIVKFKNKIKFLKNKKIKKKLKKEANSKKKKPKTDF